MLLTRYVLLHLLSFRTMLIVIVFLTNSMGGRVFTTRVFLGPGQILILSDASSPLDPRGTTVATALSLWETWYTGDSATTLVIHHRAYERR
jgi:ABC-type transport system involved in Fe-S cluster assembly fused permease/ATPase subunit